MREINSQPSPSTPDPQRLREIVSRAIALPTDQRAAYIAHASESDAALAAEARALVAAHDAAGSFMGSPTNKQASPPPVANPADPTLITPLREGPGTRVGPYKLLELIGEGGFGSVFLADQAAPVRRRVALKIIKLGMDTRGVVARFEQERQALAMMDHPHIARVLDAGSTESGRPFFVMEYVKGDPITTFADAHKLTLRQRLELLTQVCLAVQHAHHKGIIHRDIKPSNVLVSMVDGKPMAKVIDFGIAKATGGGGAGGTLTDKTLFTEHRALIGTPEYMSPEQAEGSPDIDTRADVYGLGVLMYELLTGTTPFDPKRLRSAAYAEIQRIIREEEPPSPSLRMSRDIQRDVKQLADTAARRRVEPQKLNTLMRGELDWIVMKALDKDRARRFATPQDLAADIERHLRGEAVVAAPASAAYRVRKFVRRNKGAVGAVSAVTAVLLIGIAGTTLGFWQARREASRTALALVKVDELRDAAEWSAYTANLALAQAAMDAGNYPESRKRLADAPESKRGWEWTFLARRAGSVKWAWAESENHLPVMVFNRAGDRIVLASTIFGNVSVRDTTTGQETLAFKVDYKIQSASYSKDEKHIVLGFQKPPTSFVYSAETGELLSKREGEFSERDRTGSPDGSRFLEYWNGSVGRLVEGKTEKVLVELIGHRQPVSGGAFSDDGSKVLTWSDDGTLRVWDPNAGSCLGVLTGHEANIMDAVFSPDGRLIVSYDYDGRIFLWDASSAAGLASGTGPVDHLGSRSWGTDLWQNFETLDLELAAVRSESSTPLRSGLAITTPDGTRRIVASADKTLRFYDASGSNATFSPTSAAPERQLRELAIFRMPAAVSNLEMTGDGTRLIISLADGSARVWDIREPEERRKAEQARLAERAPALAVVNRLWNDTVTASDGTVTPRIPFDKLRDAVIADASLTALRRLVTAELLKDRIAEADRAAGVLLLRRFTDVANRSSDPAIVLAAARETDLPPREKEFLLKNAAEWKPPAAKSDADQELADETAKRQAAETEAAKQREMLADAGAFAECATYEAGEGTVIFSRPPTPGAMRHLPRLSGVTTVRLMPAQGSEIGDETLRLLADKGEGLKAVTELTFYGTQVTDAGLKDLARADTGLNALTYLALDGEQVTDAGVKDLARADTGLKALTALDVSGTQVTDAGVKDLARADTGLKVLELLNLAFTQVTDAGVKELARADTGLKTLTWLSLGGRRVTDAGVRDLVRADTGLKALNTLKLSSTQVTDAGVKDLARADTGVKALTSLDLSRTQVTDEGLKDLARADTGLKALNTLNLSYTQVTDAGVKDLARADTGVNALTELNLSNTRVTDEGVAAVKARWPRIRVSR